MPMSVMPVNFGSLVDPYKIFVPREEPFDICNLFQRQSFKKVIKHGCVIEIWEEPLKGLNIF